MRFAFALSLLLFIGVESSFATAKDSTYLDSLKQEVLKSPENRASLHFKMAHYLYNQTYGYASEQDSVMAYLNLAIHEAKEDNESLILARSYMYKGKALARAGLFVASNEAVKKGMQVFRQMGDSLYVSKMEYIMGYNYQDLGMYNEGVALMERAMERSRELGDTFFLASVNLAMGTFLNSTMQFEVSRKYTREAIALLPEDRQLEKGGAHHNLANSFNHQGLYDSAYVQFEIALDIWKAIGYKRGEGVLYTNLSKFFSDQKNYDRAIDYLLKSESLLLEVGDMRELKRTYQEIAENYIFLKNADKAAAYINKAQAASEDLNTFAFLHEQDRLWALVYELRGNYQKAFFYQKEFLRRSDTLIKQEAEANVLEADRRLQFLKRSKDLELEAISLQAFKKEREVAELKQTSYFLVIILVLAVSSIIIFLLINRRKREKERLELTINKGKAANELLQKEIDIRRKKLSSYALQLIDKNQKLEQLKEGLEQLKGKSNDAEIGHQLQQLEKLVQLAMNSEQNWEEFKLYFEEVHTDFFKRLQQKHDNLTNRELRLAAFLRLNLSTKEIANLLNLPVKTIEVARYRFRKKLELDSKENLVEYMMSFS